MSKSIEQTLSSKVSRLWSFTTKPTSFNELKLTEKPVPSPNSLEKDEVLVKNHAVSLQARDLTISNGMYQGPLAPNLIPCSDAAGEVVAVGSEVTSWKIGDRVCANFFPDYVSGPRTFANTDKALGGSVNGVLSEYSVHSSHSLVKIPYHLTYEQASTLPCATLTAYNALFGQIPLKSGDTVLVLGTGGVSIAGLQIALASGASVIITTSSKEKEKVVKQLGATHVLNYNENPNWSEEVLKLTKGRGVDHVLETGGPPTLSQSLDSIKVNGLIHIIGVASGIEGSSAIEIVLQSIRKSAIIRGVAVGSVAQFEGMNQLIEKASVVPVVDKVFSFEEAKDAFAYLASQKHVGKVVIKVAD